MLRFARAGRYLLLSICILIAGRGFAAFAQESEVAKPTLPDAPVPAGAVDEGNGIAFDSQTTSSSSQTTPATQATPSPNETDAQKAQREKAEAQVKQQEQQRVLGVMPNFNVAYNKDAPPISAKQKFSLAFHTAKDPVSFVVAGLDAAYSQATDAFGPEFKTQINSAGQKVVVREEGYGQGMQGYGKRLGASYADNFDGTMIGNAILPVLLKEDPRYFRMGVGTFKHRALYAVSTTFWCKRDNGKWGPNYANVLGNLAAGGISNIYYPSTDRGASLTITRGLTVTLEGTLGGLTNEFLPDLTRRFLHRDVSGKRGIPTSATTTTPAPDAKPAPAPPPPAPQP
jgi:hypothetical protein